MESQGRRPNEGLGVFSLKAATAGFALTTLAILGLVTVPDVVRPENTKLVAGLLVLLFGVLEVLALLAGLGAWSSRAGKMGALLALILLAAGVVLGLREASDRGWIECPWRRSGALETAPEGVEPRAPVAEEPAPPVTREEPLRKTPRESSEPEKPPRRRSPGELFPNVEPE